MRDDDCDVGVTMKMIRGNSIKCKQRIREYDLCCIDESRSDVTVYHLPIPIPVPLPLYLFFYLSIYSSDASASSSAATCATCVTRFGHTA